MVIRRRKSDDYIGPSTGVMKWVNKFFRFILFPFIHPLFFVVLLVVLGGMIVGIHYFADVAYKDIPSWVATQSKNAWEKISQNVGSDFMTSVSQKVSKVSSTTGDVLESLKSSGGDDAGDVKSNREFVRAIDRKAFKKAQDIPIDVKATIEGKSIAQEDKTDSLFVFKRDDTLGLTYRSEPRVVVGSVEVISANEIKINGEQMFLYGIYSAPTSTNGVDGEMYIKNLVEGKEVECRVVAFTKNAELTAMCAVDGVSINHKMVDMGFSQNICLR